MSASRQFSGKNILVVGGTGGLGGAVVRRLVAGGARVTVSGRDETKLAPMAEALEISIVAADVTDPAARQELAEGVDLLDGFVFAAGIAPLAPTKYLKETAFEQCMALNATAPLLLVRDLLKRKKLNDGASIVWFSSIAAARGTVGYTMYAGSKAALEAEARCLALELAPKGIRVNCVAPGMVASAMAEEASDAISAAAMDAHLAAYPLGAGTPDDVAGAVMFLLSPAARWVTGVTLTVDGGFSI